MKSRCNRIRRSQKLALFPISCPNNQEHLPTTYYCYFCLAGAKTFSLWAMCIPAVLWLMLYAKYRSKNVLYLGCVVVKWSACLPSTPTIRVRIPLKPSVFSVKFMFEKNEIKHKEARIGPFLKRVLY